MSRLWLVVVIVLAVVEGVPGWGGDRMKSAEMTKQDESAWAKRSTRRSAGHTSREGCVNCLRIYTRLAFVFVLR